MTLPSGAGLAVIFAAEGDALCIEPEEAAIRYGDAVGVARQIGEHGFGPSERRLGVDHPALLPDGREVPQECATFGELCHAAEENELPAIMEGTQPGQEQAAEQGAKDAYRQQEWQA